MSRTLALVALLLAVVACDGRRDRVVRLATTTSTQNSGLLEFLLPPFERETGIEVQVLAVGTGQALALGERGDVDLVLVHARAREDAFVAAGSGLDRRDVMWNDFVIAGPTADPAGVRTAVTARAALARIAAVRATFVSRGDDSGTHTRERALWGDRLPAGEPFYLSAGQGMGACLILADEKGAYLLADRGTFLAFADRIGLAVLVEGDPELRNPYGAICVAPDRHPGLHVEPARRLLDYLTSAEGQERISAFRVHGRTLFHPAAADR